MGRRPNVVLFMSDQQRADTLPGASKVDVHAPHLRWLADRGVTFRSAFCASPLCTPARAAALTGLYPHASGVEANYDMKPRRLSLHRETKVLADYLKPAGYRCAYVGKWHLPTDNDRRGFTDFVRRIGGHDVDNEESDDGLTFARKCGLADGISLNYASYLSPRKAVPAPTSGRATRLPLAFHHSSCMAQEAAQYIHRQAGRDGPFLLVYSCIEPHALGMRYGIVPAPFDRMYDPAQMPLPETRRDRTVPRIVRKRNIPGLAPTDSFTDDQLREMMALYYGAVSYVDYLVGILLQALIASDQLDDTLFIFTSDHGEMMGDHRMLKKGPIMYEEMIRVPLVIKGVGGMARGAETSQLVSHVDLLPTILHACGVPAPAELPGRPLQGMLSGDDQPVRDGVAVEYHSRHWGETLMPLRAWRTREWKYVETIGGDDELYNLRDDPAETRNLAEDPAFSERKATLRAQLREWTRKSGDPWPRVREPGHRIEMKPGPWAALAAEETGA